MVCELQSLGKTVDLLWVKGHQGTPANEKADVPAGKPASRTRHSKAVSIAYLKLGVSERFNTKKKEWHASPDHHGTDEIPHAWTGCVTPLPALWLRFAKATEDQPCT
jgi:hypothetical protein